MDPFGNGPDRRCVALRHGKPRFGRGVGGARTWIIVCLQETVVYLEGPVISKWNTCQKCMAFWKRHRREWFKL